MQCSFHTIYTTESAIYLFIQKYLYTQSMCVQCARLNTLIQMENNHLALKMARIDKRPVESERSRTRPLRVTETESRETGDERIQTDVLCTHF